MQNSHSRLTQNKTRISYIHISKTWICYFRNEIYEESCNTEQTSDSQPSCNIRTKLDNSPMSHYPYVISEKFHCTNTTDRFA